MRYIGILSLTLLAVVLLPGCETNPSSNPDTDAKVSNAKEKIREAAQATAEAAEAKRDEYARDIRKRLDELDVKFEELKDRAAQAEGQAKQELEEKLEVAKLKRDAAAKKLDELKQAGADRWEKVKEGVGTAVDELKKVFD